MLAKTGYLLDLVLAHGSELGDLACSSIHLAELITIITSSPPNLVSLTHYSIPTSFQSGGRVSPSLCGHLPGMIPIHLVGFNTSQRPSFGQH